VLNAIIHGEILNARQRVLAALHTKDDYLNESAKFPFP
jgi:hypothetical protein